MKEIDVQFVAEWRFDYTRQWRADYAVWRRGRSAVLVEFEGGVWTMGRHTRGKGFIADLEKYNTASAMGFRIFRFTPQQVLRGEAKEFIKKWL